ncbi:hypothetical protein MKW92_008696 [Papaver armeniacum]|nr:hypothetical protein MKW92_008696 [Papaver armeniacum]
MGDLPRHVAACLHSGKLAMLAILVSAGIVLQILACALYNNWWPMLTMIMYVLLPMPLIFFLGSDTSSLLNSSERGSPSYYYFLLASEISLSSWVGAAKFLTGFSLVGSIAIPTILKHADVIGWGAWAMVLSSFFIFISAILCTIQMNNEDEYSSF